MSSEFELKGLYRRLDHLLKFSNRVTLATLLLGFICGGLYFRGVLGIPEAWLSIASCYFLGIATSHFIILRKLKHIVESNRNKWGQEEAS